jgi:ElaB/YqjD/DUF883 family membrane-anchored ribosome-binding protein
VFRLHEFEDTVNASAARRASSEARKGAAQLRDELAEALDGQTRAEAEIGRLRSRHEQLLQRAVDVVKEDAARIQSNLNTTIDNLRGQVERLRRDAEQRAAAIASGQLARTVPRTEARVVSEGKRRADGQVKQLEGQVEDLEAHLEEALAEVERLKAAIPSDATSSLPDILTNFLHALPQNSQLRGRLLSALVYFAGQLDDPVPVAELAKQVQYDERTLRRAAAKYDFASDPVLQSCETVTAAAARRLRVSYDTKEGVQAFIYSCCEHSEWIDANGEYHEKYIMWDTKEHVWSLYIQGVVGQYFADHPECTWSGDEAFERLVENQSREGRVAVGRTTFMAYFPADIEVGEEREASCPKCRAYAKMSRDVMQFLPSSLHASCPDKSTCMRTQSCQAVEAARGGLSPDELYRLGLLHAQLPERDEHKELRGAQKEAIDTFRPPQTTSCSSGGPCSS